MKKNGHYIKLKATLASLAFASSIIIALIAMFMPPQGEISASVLYFTAETLVFSATLLGFSINFDVLKQIATNLKDNEKDNE